MRSLLRAWSSYRSRPTEERTRLMGVLVRQARTHGLRSALDTIRQGGVSAAIFDEYPAWCEAHTPGPSELARMREAAARFAYQPLVTIITPVYNTDPRWLDACADSVLAQAYPRWQWSIGNDGSTNPGTLAALQRIAARDSRIVISHAPSNGGISAASNLALSKAEGEYVALMDSDDALLPHTLFRMVAHLNGSAERADVLYSDEDKLDFDGRRCEAYFKPDWSPDLFLSNMFVCHLLMARRTLIHEVGAFRTAFDFSQDFDLMLRLMEKARRIDHVPDILYHWRKVPQSGATAGDAKPAAHVAGRRALQDFLDRNDLAGEVVDAGPPGFYRARYRVDSSASVSVVALPSADASAGSATPAVAAPPGTLEVVADARAARGDFLLFLSETRAFGDEQCLQALLEASMPPWVGAVCGKVLAPDGRLLQAGLVVGGPAGAASPLAGSADGAGYFGSGIAVRNVSAAGASGLLTRRDLFERLGGFDAALGPDARAIDYSLKVWDAGCRVVHTPWARLIDRGHGAIILSAADRARLRERWGARLDADPFYNPNLSTDPWDYRVRV